MKKMIRLQRVILILLALILITGSAFAQGFRNGMKEGVVRVKFKPQLSATLKSVKTSSVGGVLQTGIQAFDKVNVQLSAVEIKRVFPYSPRHEAKHKKYGLDLWYELRYTNSVSPTEAVAGYMALGEISKAEPVFEKSLITGEVMNVTAPSNSAESNFNDPHLARQWHYNNTGEQVEVSVAGADINLFKAWEIETGKPNVVVCIVDGGVDVDHDDLAANMWVNQAELNGEEGVDDDGNGYVDDIHGYNFVKDEGEISDHSHGTHVAGTVAAVNNNGIGVAGVAGGSGNNDGARIMSAQIFSTEGGQGDYAAAIVYGADNGAVISQNSWGYSQQGAVEGVVLDAIDYFVAEAGQYEGSPMKGGMVFFAAGNDNKDGEFYPGYYDKTIAVSSLGADFKRAPYSNYGEWVDIAAPGGNKDYGTDHGVLSTLPNNKYGHYQGTSMACPHMSGIAALVVSKHGGADFTSEDLKTHILTATHDIDQYNPGYEGKLGVGYIDTWMALQSDKGIAPVAITDVSLLGIAQDFATINWTVHADEDDIQPVAFEVLYSTGAITNANADLVEKINLSSKDSVGTVKEIEIPELEPTTTYYFAVRSIDRWGNVSEVSNIVSGTTNTGPAINTDKEVMNFSVDAAVTTTTGGSFTILNEDEGVLKWEGSTRQIKHKLSYNSAGLNYPESPTAAVSQMKIGRMEMLEEARIVKDVSITPMATAEPMASFYEEFYYGNPWSSPIAIGEMDTTFTNSSAIRYHVGQAEGFNMTHVEMFLKHVPATGPMIMEVYQGEQINKKNLIFAQEVTSYKSDAYWHYITLDEQLYFDKGTTFWIVFHAPSGNLYPLGMVRENEPEYSDNCLISMDMGRSWKSLEEAIEGNPNYSWSTAAISKNKHLGHYISLNPSSGTVEGYGNQEVEISLDASTLINGDYNANLVLKSNDGDNSLFRVPLSLEVTGHEPVLVNEKVIDFGSVFYGHKKEITISIQNTGYGNFRIKSAVSTDDQFEIVKKPSNIAARDEAELTLLYTPDGAGNDNGSIEFTDKLGHTHSISLFGVGAAPSEIQISPAEQQLSDMAVGDTTSTSITITNTGAYPLEYVIPSFAPDAEIDGLESIHKYGYTFESNVDGDTTAVFAWNDITSQGVEVSEYFKNVSSAHSFLEVDLGFEFPFYGRKVNKINLTRYGLLALDQNGPLVSCSPASMKNGCTPDGFITAITQAFDINKSGNIYYLREPGKFIVQYQDVLKQGSWNETQLVSFQIVLFYNGDIEFRYKDIERMDSYTRKNALIGACDPAHADPYLVNGKKDNDYKISGRLSTNETIFRLKGPGQQLITSVSEPQGMIKVGESKTIDLALSTDGLYEGNLFQRLAIVSNDPFHNPAAFSVKVDVTSGGAADVSIDRDTLDMGQVFQGGARRDMVVLKNEGTMDVEISSIALANNRFILEGDAPVLLKAKSSYFVFVELITTEKGVIEDHLLFETSDGKSFQTYLRGEVIGAPGITVDVTPVSETLEAGDRISKTITIENNGEADLEIVPAGNDWLHLSDVETMDASLKNFSYYALTSDDEDGPAFNWEEIRENGMHIDPYWYLDNKTQWKAIPLPYELSFYEQTCDTLWVSWEGLISMSKQEYDFEMVKPSPIPATGQINNFIAPYFALQNWDNLNPNYEEEVGVFIQIFDDRVVVEWAEYIDLFWMGGTYSFEAILYKNGNIKFQYKTGSRSRTTYGAIGVENADGTDGLQLAYKQDFFKDGLAVSLIPAKKQIIPAGQSKQLDVSLDATHLNKGEYTGNFRIFNNTPQNGEVMVPVTLTVNGEPLIETPDSIEYGEVMAYEISGDFGPELISYYQEFEVKNTGRDVLEFSSISLQEGSEAKVEIEVLDSRMGYKMWQEISRWNLPTIVPGDKARMRIRLMASGANAEINDNLVFVSNLPSGDYQLPIHASVSLPPVFELGQDTLSVMANTPTYQETRTLSIDNTNGLSPLKYQLGINFQREGEEEDAEAASVLNFVSAPLDTLLSVENVEVNNIQLFSEESYNAILEYDTLSTPDNSIGFGPDLAFTSGTAFQAPEIGFNLTHVKTWYNYDETLSSRITVEIRAGGTSISDARVLTRESFDFNVEKPGSQYVTFELTENQIFYPGETFYVVIDYPLGVPNPQAIANGVEDVAGRFMYSNGTDWADLREAGFAGSGWMVKALEKEHKAKAWVSIDGELEGAVPAGESRTVNLIFKASDAQDIDNDAALTIVTNDPFSTEGEVALFLHKNQGPQLELESELMVNENDTLNFIVTANDMEGDVCSYTLAEAYDFVQMTAQNDTISFVYAPDFESAGLSNFTLIGEDEHGNATQMDIPVEVMNVNRAPELIGIIEAREYYQDEAMESIDMNAYFVDPDSEELSYDFHISDISIANIYTWNKGIMIEPLMDGLAEITVIASDLEGLSAESTFNLTIGTVTGIEDPEGSTDTQVYPVPTSGPLNIVLGNDIEGEVSISVLNVTGLTQYQTTLNKMSGEHIERLNISNMPSGIYLVKITSAKGDIVKRVVKL